jgi:hypothetical protein
MSEIKFACPHCSQHIACDDIYCGERIDCPGCKKELFIPQRAAFIPLHSGNLTMALPIAAKEKPPASVAGLDLLTEEEWTDRASQSGALQPSRMLPVWILLFLPFVLALVLVVNRANPALLVYGFIFCALAVGLYLATIQKKSGVMSVLLGLLYSIVAFLFYAIMAIGILFIGCLTMLH